MASKLISLQERYEREKFSTFFLLSRFNEITKNVFIFLFVRVLKLLLKTYLIKVYNKKVQNLKIGSSFLKFASKTGDW